MTLPKIVATILFATCLTVLGGPSVLAQVADQVRQPESKDEDINLDTQLYLLIGNNQEVADGKLPPALYGVARQLHTSLPFKNYRLAATLINRVKNEGHLNLRWVGGPLSAANTPNSPSFSDFRVHQIKLARDSQGQQVVRLTGFGFGARIPISSGNTVAANGPIAPIINYENTGLETDISMREGEPVIVGTLQVGPSEAIILIMAAKRTPQ